MPARSLDPPYEGDAFYCKAMETLEGAGVPFLVGGAYALRVYTGIVRETKDFDVFIRPADIERALAAFAREGFRTDLTYPHWLGKALCGDWFIDLIFRAGNGLCEVDDAWFAHARQLEMLGRPVLICPPEEILRMKSYIMERERFDGADIAHLLRHCAEEMDWRRLLAEFGPDWRVLLSHLVLFGFIYPAERGRLPAWVLEELLRRTRDEITQPPPPEKICGGTLISRSQYQPDIELWGYRDARLEDRNRMTPQDIAHWTAAIAPKDRSAGEPGFPPPR